MPTVNLGILAHVDAGKTSLTERLLYDTGVIDRLGSVDTGDTQTDTGDIERRRGITIRAAVASFPLADRQVNLIDTPGHPDFIAEVERALAVLDAVILVISAVEGVQAQTRVLARTLRRLRLPTLLFVNKIDRTGARTGELLGELATKLAMPVLPVNSATGAGTREVRTAPYHLDDPAYRDLVATTLADRDDALLAELVDGATPAPERLRRLVVAQVAAATLHPVVFGSALTGEGTDTLRDTLRLLPTARPAPGDPDGIVFALDDSGTGSRHAYVRLRSGELRNRQRVTVQRRGPDGAASRHRGTVTAVEVVGNGASVAAAGDIAKVAGLPGVRVGDRIGTRGDAAEPAAHFPRPALETRVVAADRARAGDLRAALTRLAERDPLIGVRALPGGDTSVLLYGEVQQEVLAATLRDEFGVEARFARAHLRHIERPVGSGEAYEAMPHSGFAATVGLRIEPAPVGSGVTYRVASEPGLLLKAFHHAVAETVHATLEQGLHGWPVTDCAVSLTAGGYAAPVSTSADFRQLTPLVLMAALAAAGTRVFEPCHRFELEVPADTLGTVLTGLAAAEATIGGTRPEAGGWLIEGDIPARTIGGFQRLLPGLTRGEGAWSSRPYGDRVVHGRPPVRERTDGNPLDRAAYLQHLTRMRQGA
jgi:ribosomal protection tetracycline resistance protein